MRRQYTNQNDSGVHPDERGREERSGERENETTTQTTHNADSSTNALLQLSATHDRHRQRGISEGDQKTNGALTKKSINNRNAAAISYRLHASASARSYAFCVCVYVCLPLCLNLHQGYTSSMIFLRKERHSPCCARATRCRVDRTLAAAPKADTEKKH